MTFSKGNLSLSKTLFTICILSLMLGRFFFLSRFSFKNIHESQESSYCRELRRCFQRIGNILADCILAFSKFKLTFFGWIYHCCFFPQCLKIFVKPFSQSLFINDNFTFEKNYVFITWNRYFSCILFSTNAHKSLHFTCQFLFIQKIFVRCTFYLKS